MASSRVGISCDTALSDNVGILLCSQLEEAVQVLSELSLFIESKKTYKRHN